MAALETGSPSVSSSHPLDDAQLQLRAQIGGRI